MRSNNFISAGYLSAASPTSARNLQKKKGVGPFFLHCEALPQASSGFLAYWPLYHFL
jgi:hypothetical protein